MLQLYKNGSCVCKCVCARARITTRTHARKNACYTRMIQTFILKIRLTIDCRSKRLNGVLKVTMLLHMFSVLNVSRIVRFSLNAASIRSSEQIMSIQIYEIMLWIKAENCLFVEKNVCPRRVSAEDIHSFNEQTV